MAYVIISDSDGEWGVSRGGPNPDRDDFVLCGSRCDAERLYRWLSEAQTTAQLEALAVGWRTSSGQRQSRAQATENVPLRHRLSGEALVLTECAFELENVLGHGSETP